MERFRITSKKGLAIRAGADKSTPLVATLSADAILTRVTERAGRSLVVTHGGDHAGWATTRLLKADGISLALRRLVTAGDAATGAQMLQACLDCGGDDDRAKELYDALLARATTRTDAPPAENAGVAAAMRLFGLASAPAAYAAPAS